MLAPSSHLSTLDGSQWTYYRIPQGNIVVRAKGQHACLHIPLRSTGVPITSNTDIIGDDSDHGELENLKFFLVISKLKTAIS
jgi:hypothetical protein